MFAKNQYSLMVQSFDPSLGSVTGNGVYDYLDTVIVTATATAPHYFFEHWSDGSTDSSHSVVITGNRVLTAYFAIDTHTVIVQADSIAYGSVSGGGRYTYGTVATLTAAPYSGYRFSHWSNGATYNPYIFAVLSDTVLTAHFIANWEPYQDTIYVYDTVYVSQYIHDTIYIHDTVYVGVDGVETIDAKIYTSQGRIVVEGAEGNTVWLYDVNGRVLATRQDEYLPLQFDVPASGTYLIKVGRHPARKIVVIR